MKYWCLLIIITTIALQAHINTQPFTKPTPQNIATYIYGPQGLNVPVAEYQKIENLIVMIDNSTLETKIQAIPRIIESLEKTLQETNTYIKQQYNKQLEVPISVFFKTFILNHQISYLKKEYDTLCTNQDCDTQNINWLTRFIRNISTWIRSFFTHKQIEEHPSTESLTQQIIDYINFERENILFDYYKQLSFFTSIEKMPLPSIINFWKSKKIQHQMYLRVQQISERIVPQFGIDTIIDFAIQGILMAGGSMAIQWVDQDDANIFKTLSSQQDQIQQSLVTFMSSIQKNAQQIMSNVLTNFKVSLQKIQDEYSASNKLMQNEIQYLMRSISLDQPKQLYLVAPLNYDLAFEAAPMATPSPYTWYNIAQKGDWEYDSTTNSFWQNGLQLFGVPAWKKNPATNKPGEDVPEFNSIFMESVVNGSTYEVEAECTIYTVSGSPFFAGIMFNKARWVSGDPERLTGYRLLGMYGMQTNTEDPTTRSIDAVFAQQQIIPAKGTTSEQILSPLQIIDTQKTAHFATNILTADDLKVLGIEPLTLVFNVSTSPTSVICTISKQETNSQGITSLKQLAQKTIQGLDNYAFLYHGIGFMTPGCQASCKLTKPVELLYTQDQINTYKQLKSS